MIAKAREHFRAAELLLNNSLLRDAASRAYYAIYSAIYAVIGDPTRGNYWSHPGIRKAIVQRLHEEGQDDISERFNKDIYFVYQMRIVADYQSSPISEERATEVISRAQNILNWAERRLGV